MRKSYNAINEYARNVRQPSLEDLYKIAEILNTEVKDLLIERKKQKWQVQHKDKNYKTKYGK